MGMGQRRPGKPKMGGKASRTPQKVSRDQGRRLLPQLRRQVETVTSTPGSGNGPHRKGDEEVAEYELVERKATDSASYRVTLQELAKIVEEAASAGRRPVFIVSFNNAPFPVPKDWELRPVRDSVRARRGE